MNGERIAAQLGLALATARASARQRRIAAALAVGAVVAFVAVVPFVRMPLPKVPAFIPAYQSVLFFIDLTTVALLLDQFLRLRSIALLVLASGYLFDALIIIPHSLSFPGAFVAGGLLGAGPQTTAWLYVFWHGGFPLFVIAYALLRRHEPAPSGWAVAHPGRLIICSFAAVAVFVVALTALATRGHGWLPVVMQGSDYSMLVSKGVSPAVWLLTLAALASLWQSQMRVVDLWLMLVMWVWLFDIGLAAILGSQRFDLGFYVGRLFGLAAAGALLAALFIEMVRMYAEALAATARAAERPSAEVSPPANRREQPQRPSATVESFIREKNIAHYRSLLGSGRLAEGERRTIEMLLLKEEASGP